MVFGRQMTLPRMRFPKTTSDKKKKEASKKPDIDEAAGESLHLHQLNTAMSPLPEAEEDESDDEPLAHLASRNGILSIATTNGTDDIEEVCLENGTHSDHTASTSATASGTCTTSATSEMSGKANGSKGKGKKKLVAKLGGRISRALSHDSNDESKPRSQSRGREFRSSGRGGLGNLRPPSKDPDQGKETYAVTRGRENNIDPAKIRMTGRGGAGNIRSPSRDANSTLVGPTEHEKEIIKEHKAAELNNVRASGRGGFGNIKPRSTSRDVQTTLQHSTGRGGAGNMALGDGVGNESLDAKERSELAHPEGMHSIGRGGAANLTTTPSAPIEHPPHIEGEYESSGRGGSGNIHHSRSRSRDITEEHRKSSGGFGGFFHKVTHSGSQHHDHARLGEGEGESTLFEE